jgi:hypothetical protein
MGNLKNKKLSLKEMEDFANKMSSNIKNAEKDVEIVIRNANQREESYNNFLKNQRKAFLKYMKKLGIGKKYN